jgi:hypothetical protein
MLLKLREALLGKPERCLLLGAILGAFAAVLNTSPYPVTSMEKPILMFAAWNLLIGAFLAVVFYAAMYYFVTGKRYKQMLRELFADLFFLTVGIIFGYCASGLFFGEMSPLQAITSAVALFAPLAVSYQQLVVLYRRTRDNELQ